MRSSPVVFISTQRENLSLSLGPSSMGGFRQASTRVGRVPPSHSRERFYSGPANSCKIPLAISFQRLIGLELGADDHVANMDRVRQHGILLQLLQRGPRIVVVHGSPPDF